MDALMTAILIVVCVSALIGLLLFVFFAIVAVMFGIDSDPNEDTFLDGENYERNSDDRNRR